MHFSGVGVKTGLQTHNFVCFCSDTEVYLCKCLETD